MASARVGVAFAIEDAPLLAAVRRSSQQIDKQFRSMATEAVTASRKIDKSLADAFAHAEKHGKRFRDSHKALFQQTTALAAKYASELARQEKSTSSIAIAEIKRVTSAREHAVREALALERRLSVDTQKIHQQRMRDFQQEAEHRAAITKRMAGGYGREVFGQIPGGAAAMGFLGAGSKGMMAAVATGAALGGIAKGYIAAAHAAMSFEDAVADMDAIIGGPKSQLDELSKRARQLGMDFGISAVEGVEMFKLILSQLGPEMADDPKALDSMSRSALSFAKAAGIDASEATATLTNAMNQMGLAIGTPIEQAREMARVANVMAAGAKVGAMEIPALKEAFLGSAIAAHELGLSVEKTVATLEVVRKSGLDASEAGTAFRAVLQGMSQGSEEASKVMARVGLRFEDINPKVVGLEKGLENLKRGYEAIGKKEGPVGQATFMAKLFGDRYGAAGLVLMNNIDLITRWTREVTATTEATDQAQKKMATTSEEWKRFNSTLEDTAITVGNRLLPSLKELGTTLNNNREGLVSLGKAAVDTIGLIARAVSMMGSAFEAVKADVNRQQQRWTGTFSGMAEFERSVLGGKSALEWIGLGSLEGKVASKDQELRRAALPVDVEAMKRLNQPATTGTGSTADKSLVPPITITSQQSGTGGAGGKSGADTKKKKIELALPEARFREMWPLIVEAADKAGVNPQLLAALVWQESNFSQKGKSGKTLESVIVKNGKRQPGALGLTQLMRGTAASLGVDPHDTKDNLLGGARYLRQQLDAFDGDLDKALAAYNAGPGRVREYKGVPPFKETKDYVKLVQERFAYLGGASKNDLVTTPATDNLFNVLLPSGSAEARANRAGRAGGRYDRGDDAKNQETALTNRRDRYRQHYRELETDRMEYTERSVQLWDDGLEKELALEQVRFAKEKKAAEGKARELEIVEDEHQKRMKDIREQYIKENSYAYAAMMSGMQSIVQQGTDWIDAAWARSWQNQETVFYKFSTAILAATKGFVAAIVQKWVEKQAAILLAGSTEVAATEATAGAVVAGEAAKTAAVVAGKVAIVAAGAEKVATHEATAAAAMGEATAETIAANAGIPVWGWIAAGAAVASIVALYGRAKHWFADGGIVTKPVFSPMLNGGAVAGEAGPEAIIPLSALVPLLSSGVAQGMKNALHEKPLSVEVTKDDTKKEGKDSHGTSAGHGADTGNGGDHGADTGHGEGGHGEHGLVDSIVHTAHQYHSYGHMIVPTMEKAASLGEKAVHASNFIARSEQALRVAEELGPDVTRLQKIGLAAEKVPHALEHGAHGLHKFLNYVGLPLTQYELAKPLITEAPNQRLDDAQANMGMTGRAAQALSESTVSMWNGLKPFWAAKLVFADMGDAATEGLADESASSRFAKSIGYGPLPTFQGGLDAFKVGLSGLVGQQYTLPLSEDYYKWQEEMKKYDKEEAANPFTKRVVDNLAAEQDRKETEALLEDRAQQQIDQQDALEKLPVKLDYIIKQQNALGRQSAGSSNTSRTTGMTTPKPLGQLGAAPLRFQSDGTAPVEGVDGPAVKGADSPLPKGADGIPSDEVMSKSEAAHLARVTGLYAGINSVAQQGLGALDNLWKSSFNNQNTVLVTALSAMTDVLKSQAAQWLTTYAQKVAVFVVETGTMIGSALASAAASIFSFYAALGPFGIPAAIGTVGALFAAYKGVKALVTGDEFTLFAEGGVVDRPIFSPLMRGGAIAGEAGPEAILPLRSIVPLVSEGVTTALGLLGGDKKNTPLFSTMGRPSQQVSTGSRGGLTLIPARYMPTSGGYDASAIGDYYGRDVVRSVSRSRYNHTPAGMDSPDVLERLDTLIERVADQKVVLDEYGRIVGGINKHHAQQKFKHA